MLHLENQQLSAAERRANFHGVMRSIRPHPYPDKQEGARLVGGEIMAGILRLQQCGKELSKDTEFLRNVISNKSLLQVNATGAITIEKWVHDKLKEMTGLPSTATWQIAGTAEECLDKQAGRISRVLSTAAENACAQLHIQRDPASYNFTWAQKIWELRDAVGSNVVATDAPDVQPNLYVQIIAAIRVMDARITGQEAIIKQDQTALQSFDDVSRIPLNVDWTRELQNWVDWLTPNQPTPHALTDAQSKWSVAVKILFARSEQGRAVTPGDAGAYNTALGNYVRSLNGVLTRDGLNEAIRHSRSGIEQDMRKLFVLKNLRYTLEVQRKHLEMAILEAAMEGASNLSITAIDNGHTIDSQRVEQATDTVLKIAKQGCALINYRVEDRVVSIRTGLHFMLVVNRFIWTFISVGVSLGLGMLSFSSLIVDAAQLVTAFTLEFPKSFIAILENSFHASPVTLATASFGFVTTVILSWTMLNWLEGACKHALEQALDPEFKAFVALENAVIKALDYAPQSERVRSHS